MCVCVELGCGSDDAAQATATEGLTDSATYGTTGTGGDCEPLSAMDGQWLPPEQGVDFTDPHPPGNDFMSDPCGWDMTSLTAHHCFITAVHAIHLHTGKLLVYHGARDQRVVSLDANPEDPGGVVWTPLTVRKTDPYPEEDWADLFCSGHAQLADGSILIAGGNFDGRPQNGGLKDIFRYLPPRYTPDEAAAPGFDLGCPYQWDLDPVENDPWENPHPEMLYDRWYPTLTTLGDGRVLITGGTTRHDDPAPGDAENSRVVELYDPATKTITRLPDFPDGPGGVPTVPLYPFMFALPNGDVLYAGGESTSDPDNTQGRVLVAPENTMGGDWAWSPYAIGSDITGASAVMYEPGKILKSGGRARNQNEYGAYPGDEVDEETDPFALRTHRAEKIDLSDVPGGVDSYQGLSFEPAASMHQGRHFHNLVLLPNGNVLAVGGNHAGNGAGTHHWQNPCKIEVPNEDPLVVLEQDCATGCPSTCVEYETFPEHLKCADNTTPRTTEARCAFIDSIECCAGRPEHRCEGENGVDGCTWDGSQCVETSGDDRCGIAMIGASCDAGVCQKLCDPENGGSDCPDIMPVDDECLLEAGEYPGQCSPANNECYATYTAEIWDPTCDTWVELGPQEHPRMYHSTALLLPDATVLSMGNGHVDFQQWQDLTDYPVSERFIPQYAPGGDDNRPTLTIVDEITDPDVEDDEHYLPWFNDGDPPEPGSVMVQTEGDIAGFTLVRLGSTTHGFDQDQRLIRLHAEPMGNGEENIWIVFAPNEVDGVTRARSIAPPGYYMLFALSPEGTPSHGQYVRLGDEETITYLCEADDQVLQPSRVTCAAEPLGGSCAPLDQVTTQLTLPMTDDAMGLPVEGWRVLLPQHLAGTPDEADAAEAACQQICATHFSGDAYSSADCFAPGAFTVSQVAQNEPGALDLVLPSHRFGGQGVGMLDCSLSQECFSHFDEHLVGTVPRRISPAAEVLGVGEEYRVSLAGSQLHLTCGTEDSTEIMLSGEAGFSHCDSDTGPCPFYLGSLDLQATPSATLDLACDDGTTEVVTLDAITLRLSQPAYGAEDGNLIQFGPGSLLLETEIEIDGEVYRTRRPNGVPFTLTGSGDDVRADRFVVHTTVPCGAGKAIVRIQAYLETASTLEEPPRASLSLPSRTTCGTAVALTGTFDDQDADLDTVEWFVDGVPLDDSLQSITINEAHDISAIARDERGAATTARATVTCN